MENLKLSDFLVNFNLYEKLDNIKPFTTEGMRQKLHFMERLKMEGLSTRILSEMYSVFRENQYDAAIGAFVLQLESLINENIDQYHISYLCESLYVESITNPYLKIPVSNLQGCYEKKGEDLRRAILEGKFKGLNKYPSVAYLTEKYTNIADRRLNENKQNINAPTTLPVLSYVAESAKEGVTDKIFNILGKVFAINEAKEIREADVSEYDAMFFNASNNLVRTNFVFNEAEQSFQYKNGNEAFIEVTSEGINLNNTHADGILLEAFVGEQKRFKGVDYTRIVSEAQFLNDIYENVYMMENVFMYNNQISGRECILISEGKGKHFKVSLQNGQMNVNVYDTIGEAIEEFKKVSNFDLTTKYKDRIFAEGAEQELKRVNEAVEREDYELAKKSILELQEKYDTETVPSRKKVILEAYQELANAISDYELKHKI